MTAPVIPVRKHAAELLTLSETWAQKTFAFDDAYMALYADLLAYSSQPDLDSAEESRQRVDEALLVFRQDKHLCPDEATYERELARLEACYLLASLRYQIALGYKLPHYNEAQP